MRFLINSIVRIDANSFAIYNATLDTKFCCALTCCVSRMHASRDTLSHLPKFFEIVLLASFDAVVLLSVSNIHKIASFVSSDVIQLLSLSNS